MSRSMERYAVELAYRLDVAKLKRDGWLNPGTITTGVKRWAYPWDDAEVADVTVSMGRDPCVIVQFRGEAAQRIDLASTPQRFGGVRWWLVCPFTRRRCRVLYLPNGGRLFASRQAYRLIYRSQQLSPSDRAWHRLHKLAAELGTDYSADEIERPRGMWRRTFDRKLARYAEAEARVDDTFYDFLGKLCARYPEALDGLGIGPL